MTRPIKEGDIVTVLWTNGSMDKNVKILHMPSDTGDMLYIEKDDDIYGINTNSSIFQGLALIKRQDVQR